MPEQYPREKQRAKRDFSESLVLVVFCLKMRLLIVKQAWCWASLQCSTSGKFLLPGETRHDIAYDLMRDVQQTCLHRVSRGRRRTSRSGRSASGWESPPKGYG